MLFWCWPCVADAGPTAKHHWFRVSHSMGACSNARWTCNRPCRPSCLNKPSPPYTVLRRTIHFPLVIQLYSWTGTGQQVSWLTTHIAWSHRARNHNPTRINIGQLVNWLNQRLTPSVRASSGRPLKNSRFIARACFPTTFSQLTDQYLQILSLSIPTWITLVYSSINHSNATLVFMTFPTVEAFRDTRLRT